MKTRLLYVLSVLIWTAISNAQTVEQFELNANWQFRQSGSTIWMSASVPGTVHTDLMDNGQIEDPYYRDNEKKVQWVDKTDWEYRTFFEVNQSLLAHHSIELVFEGLDTYADIFINKNHILSTDNFFISWEVDIKPILKEGKNELFIIFYSPIKKGLDLLAESGVALPASNDQSIQGGVGDHKVSIFTRKPGYHYGWDWGPRIVTSGIWRPVYIRAFSGPRIQDLYFKQNSITEQKASLTAVFSILSTEGGNYKLGIQHGSRLLQESGHKIYPGRQIIEVLFEIDNPKLWWTHELGDPHLYKLSGLIMKDQTVLSDQEQKIGLRTIKVIQSPDSAGSSFYFELNGFPVFAKGANYIPNDIFIPRVSDKTYRVVLESAQQANMNMLRVWGGGFYENDIFYDLCDQYGILVWQDFMFACSMYPGDPHFLDNVTKEATYNLKRLRNHPSIALWCGNNEIDVAWAQFDENRGWGWKQRYESETREQIWKDYFKVFHDILPRLTKEYSPDIFYWPSSPYAKDGTHADYSNADGDIHYWGVWHGQHPFTEFDNNIGRFMSEYGFQSFPEFTSVQKFTIPDDWNIESDVMTAHQRSGIGNLRILEYMSEHYNVPKEFDNILYTGQLLQAKGIQHAIEAHRRAKPYCMGTLYWQLNDCWPVASWSSMDYYTKWKALQYEVRNAFKPVILSSIQDEEQVEVYLISDRQKEASFDLSGQLVDFEGKTYTSISKKTAVGANSSNVIHQFDLEELSEHVPLNASALILQLKEEGKIIDELIHFFKLEKDLQLPKDYNLRSKIEAGKNGTFDIFLSSDKFLKGVYLFFDGIEGHFSDNYFDLAPNTSVRVQFKPQTKDLTLQEKKLKHLCLQDLN